ncbi:hypothetical protein WI73_07130 [Burkholderia ubonensis]|uniref:hypothetical protein n=2 Tax=Burkholderia ubonensis TaxID=101571 RepID=UPI0007527124|nr:hypothetical protein [Burkholderia ubonensis]KVA16852.1 hypothetical protein WI42_17400 [Burkholderia ubonensis]KVA20367.1 hypothetical protein WI43_15660 [Burkholderia ubonensis]KVA38268.1 hypothetical protein WI46_17670 [Burkholderia ubonensis]KVC74040.1 hypothetical protein WI73_07130 [Burkholderia ubonensis]
MMKTKFFSVSGKSAADLQLPEDMVLLHGEELDDRGESACRSAPENSRVQLSFGVDDMSLTVGTRKKSSDLAVELLSEYDWRKVVLEATTLGFAELFCAVNALLASGATSINIIYVEPAEYTRDGKGAELFALSEPTRGYVAIPNAIVDLASEEVEAGVFFLGFEPERLDRALEEYQMIASKYVKVVFGIPAYHPGWELDAIIPHLTALESHKLQLDYCSANDPEAAFECLERTRDTLGAEKRMFVAPIGPKPCGIASAIFASVYPKQVGLLFDHPRRKKKRSSGVDLWHRFTVTVDRSIESAAAAPAPAAIA